MKKYVNGQYIEMTEEEMEEWKESYKNAPIFPPTETERLEVLEEALLELAEVMCNG